MTATRADAVYAQHAALYGDDPDEADGVARDWIRARRSHRIPAGLVAGLLAAATAQTPAAAEPSAT